MSDLLNNVTNNTTTATIDADIKSSIYILRSCILLVLASISVCGNFIVFFTLYRRRYLLTPSNMLVFSLTISNFLFSIFVFPFMIVSSIEQVWSFGKVWCSISGFLSLTTLAASMFTLLVISCDRCYAIVFPLKYPTVVTSFRIICVVIFCWLIAASISIPPLLESLSKFQYSNAQMSCLPSWGLDFTFSCFWISLCILFPYCAMTISYSSILYVACMKTRRVRNTELKQCSTTGLNNFVCEEHKTSFKNERGRNISKCTDKAHVLVDDLSSAGCSNAVDSGIALASHDSSAKTDYSVVLPHQIVDDHFPSGFNVVMNQAFEASTNNNNAGNVLRSSIVSNPARPSSIEETLSVDYLTLPVPSGLPASASLGRSHFRSGRKSSSLHESRSTAMLNKTRSRNNSLGALNNVTEMSTLAPFSRNLSRSTNASRSSARSLASNRSKIMYSLAYYYDNQKKALCTILCVVGVLFICCGPFVVTSLYDAVHGQPIDSIYQSSVDDWLVSATTILLLLTCVYHPLFYGLWNRTLRKEMRNVICGGARGPITRRTRILSLTSHLKDVGLSPRVTSAIMQESATVATIVRPMRLDERPIRKHPTCRTYVEASSPVKWKKTSVKEKVGTTSKKTSSFSTRNKVVKKSIKPSISNTSGVGSSENNGMSKSESANQASGSHNTQQRDREQLATDGPLFINSSQVLSSEILLPALLFSSVSNNLNLDDAIATSSPCSSIAVAHTSRRATVINQSSRSDSDRASSFSSNTSTQGNVSDTVSKLTKGKLHSSNLIHLEAGEPVQIRNWNRNQTIDYFAQTLAYDLVEGIDLEL